MVKQLGLPSFFMTLSCADLRWNESISVTAKLNGENLEGDDINNMDFFERCRYLNLNPVVLAWHFQYRVEVFFKVIIIDGPVLIKDNVDEYRQFIDSIVKAFVPDISENPEHSHSKSFRKYKNEKCRYHSGKFFTEFTIISLPLPSDLPKQKKTIYLMKDSIFCQL